MAIALLQIEVTRGPFRLPGLGQCLEVLPTRDTGREGLYVSQALIVTAAARRMIELSKAGEKVDTIVVSGEVDPKLHADFREIAQNLKELAKKWFPKAQLALFCGLGSFDSPDVLHGCRLFDRLFVEIDSGTQKSFAALRGASLRGSSLRDLVERLAQVDHGHLVFHSRLQQGTVDNTTDTEMRALAVLAARLHPQRILLRTIAKGTAKGQRPAPKARMEEYAAKLSEKSGVAVEIAAEPA